MSGGFFRGTTADQDTRFSNKHAKLLKSQKFSPELENLVDMTKVKMDVMRPWIAHRVTELLGFEDEVLINFIYGLLEEKVVNGKEIQISLTGFMEKNTGKFMKELWTHLLSAQQNASGVPQQFLDAKEEETKKKQEDMDRISRELKRTKEKEGHDLEQERVKMDRDADDVKAATLEPHSRSRTKFSSKWSDNDKGTNERNGSKGRSRISRSPHSTDLSPPSNRSRSLSASPKPRRRSVSSERRHHSLPRRSITPHRVDSPLGSTSPPQQGGSYSRRTVSRSRGRSPSLVRRRLRSPPRHRSRSPVRRRSRSPVRRQTRSPIRRRSRSPVRRRSRSPFRRRSRSPVRRRSRTPIRRRSRSPIWRRSRSPIRRRSRSPFRRRSRSPMRRRSRSLVRRRSRSPMRRRSRSPIRRRSPSPFQRRSRSPLRNRSPSSASSSLSPMHARSLSPVRRRSPSPTRKRYRRAPSTPRQQSSSPIRRRATFPGRQRSPGPGSLSPSPLRQDSVSPTRGTPSPLGSVSPKNIQRSPVRSPRDGHRILERPARERQAPQKEAAEGQKRSGSLGGSVRSIERNPKGQRFSHIGEPALSSSPHNSPSSSLSPPAPGRGRNDQRSPVPTKRRREYLNTKERLDSVDVEETPFSRAKEEKRENKDPVCENKDPVDDKHLKVKPSPEKFPSHHSSDAQVQKRKSKNDDERRSYPELSETRTDMSSVDRARHTERGSPRRQEAAEVPKTTPKTERHNQSGSLDSGSEESDGVNKKRKRKRSKRKDATSDDDYSHDSRTEDKKEAKRRRKEEKRLKKEEKRKRREERRRRKDDRRAEKMRLKADNEAGEREKESDQKKLEIELREKALESLRAKKRIGH